MSTHSEDRILSQCELKQLVPFSAMHIWRLERAGRFPKRIKLGDRRVGWSWTEIMKWIEDKKKNRNNA